MGASVDRMDSVTRLVDGLKTTYPDAKKLVINIQWEWKEPADVDLDSELCPNVNINIER
jgi:hypothetical protein